MILIQSDGRWPSDRNHLGQRSHPENPINPRDFGQRAPIWEYLNPQKKNKKQITGMIEMMQRISVLFFFQGSEVMTKKMILIIQPDV